MSEYHTPVLLEESISALITNNNGIYIDATFGGGGHSAKILSCLSNSGKLIAFDRDSDAIKNKINDNRLYLVHNNFRFIHNYVVYNAYLNGLKQPLNTKVNGILADLGVSSHQFDTAERGFSFRYNAPLDMRMNTQAKQTAADIINTYKAKDLERIFRLYGEVDNARKVSDIIVNKRISKPINTTTELEEAIANILPKFAEHKYLAKLYQALRIEVNQEMKALEMFLQGASDSLESGGRLVIITYHSLEDRMVKNFIKFGNIEGKDNKDLFGNKLSTLKPYNKKPILPTEEEISLNTRARSAKLRIATKL